MPTLDDIHIDFSYIDGFDKDDNFIVSPRHDGKTTMFMIRKAYKAFIEHNGVTCIGFRNSADMSVTAIQSFLDDINKFKELKLEAKVSQTDITKGLAPVYVGGKLFLFCVSLNIPMRRLKGLHIPNITYYFNDEFIIDPKQGERYLKGEFIKYKTLIDTLRKEGRVKAYFCGNPYSLINPYSEGYKIPYSKWKRDVPIVGKNYLFLWKSLNPKLKEWLKEHDPTYSEEDEYTKMALEGLPVNDEANVKPMKGSYALKYVFSFGNNKYGVYKNQDYLSESEYFYIKEVIDSSRRRYLYTFEINEMIANTILVSKEDKNEFRHLKMAIRNQDIAYESPSCYHFVKEIYPYL